MLAASGTGLWPRPLIEKVLLGEQVVVVTACAVGSYIPRLVYGHMTAKAMGKIPTGTVVLTEQCYSCGHVCGAVG